MCIEDMVIPWMNNQHSHCLKIDIGVFNSQIQSFEEIIIARKSSKKRNVVI